MTISSVTLGRVVDLGGDGGIVQIRVVIHQQTGQAVHQLVEAVQGDQPYCDGFAGVAQIVRKVPGRAAKEAVENDQRHGKEDVVVNGVLQADGEIAVPSSRSARRNSGSGGKGQHHQIDHEETPFRRSVRPGTYRVRIYVWPF